MASWIYIFSKFTPEALLFEALVICLLCASYAAFWVLRKRKYGVLGKDVPNYAVKSYLSQLILDAEQMRIQLFGLLAGTGFDPNLMANLRSASLSSVAATGAGAGVSPLMAALGASNGAPISAAALAADPELAKKLAAIEAKMVEQARAMETITVEKVRVEKELIEARAGKGGGGDAAAGDAKLAEKIKALEAKLAEYSVIEDDLANLKRLQQENTQLKAQLGGKSMPMSEVAAAAGEVIAEPVAEPADAETLAAATAELEETPTEAPSAAVDAAAPAAEAAAAAEAVAATDAAISEAALAEPIAAATGDASFEGLVDKVEQSLVEPNSPALPETAEPPAGASVADLANPNGEVRETAGAPSSMTPTPEKTDADLVAEFEKMLNS